MKLGWKRLSVVGFVVWCVLTFFAVISDGTDACEFRQNDYFYDLLSKEYKIHGGIPPNFHYDPSRSYAIQAIDSQYKYPLPVGRLQAVINQAHDERYRGRLCDGAYLEVAYRLVPIILSITLVLIAVLFGVYLVIRWVSNGFKQH